MFSFLFSFGLGSLFIACSDKSTDSAEDTASAEPAQEPAQEPSSPTTEPSSPTTEPTDPPIEDEDNDGFSREDGDCDDTNPDVYPGAEDIPGDGIDQDCSGSDEESTGLSLDDVSTGTLIVTEIMNNPTAVSDDAGEWVEIFNNSDDMINLMGLEVSDGADDSFIIDELVILPGREHVVLGNNADFSSNGGVNVRYGYSGFVLSNSSDEVILSHNGRIIDEVVYSSDLGFALIAGKSLSLHVDKYDFNDNDIAENWCPAINGFGMNGEFGSPGEMNGTCPLVLDEDGDGFNNLIDCDDSDPAINPTATEIWYDGVDQNCNGDDDYDSDGDGFASAAYTGDDCDDNNLFINPAAYDVPGNSIDEDCDGSDAESTGASVSDLIDGDLVINEIMYNPSVVADSSGEWFEIVVSYQGTVNLGGLSICDNQGCMAIASSLEVNEGDYVVLGNEADSSLNGGVSLHYAYGTALAGLGNSGDMIELSYNGTVIDLVDFSSAFPSVNGASMVLDPDNFGSGTNDEYFNWCASTSSFGDGDLGTPGAANDTCN